MLEQRCDVAVGFGSEIEKSGVCFFNAQTKGVFSKARVKMWDEMYSELLEEKCQLQAKLGGKAGVPSAYGFDAKFVWPHLMARTDSKLIV